MTVQAAGALGRAAVVSAAFGTQPKELRMVESKKLEQKAEETKEAGAGAAVARACGVDNK